MTQPSKLTHTVFGHWLLSHYRALRFAFTEFARAPLTSIITICVIGVAIALPLGLFILLENLQVVDSQWNNSSPTISLYLKSNTTQSDVDTLMQSLRDNKGVKKITYISPAEGLKSFEQNTPFTDVISVFQKNPIPGVITVLPIKQGRNPSAINALFLRLKQLPLVDTAQLDMNWVERLYDVIAIGKDVVKALSLLFGFGVILIIGHTLRASLTTYLKEIQVLRLIGATNAYIRRPLLYRGVLYGLFGGIIAWLLIDLFMMQLQPPVSQLAHTYDTIFHLQKISFGQGSLLLLVSAVLGLIGAGLIITQFLNRPEQME